jgi:ABC-type Zn uptake system ZnuABC Zn-binding protein ZnuA
MSTRRRWRPATWAAAATTMAVLAASCAGDSSGGADGGLKVITTVAPITDLVSRVAGPDAEVVGIVPDGADSHTFQPAPSVARDLVDARLFIANGLFLEEPSLQLAAANLPAGGEIVTLAERVVTEDEWIFDFSFPRRGGVPNPHLWTSPPLAGEYARIAADELARADPDHAAGYHERYEELAAGLAALDEAIFEAVATVPSGDRKLVTYHDSYPYFAPRYGFDIIAAIQPADFSEPSAQELAALIDQIRAEDVPAVFGSEVFRSDALAQIAAETDAVYVADLRDDELPGNPGDPEHSYIGMMSFNVRTIVEALGGDPAALDAVDPGA